jgi:tripartite-type tricarboxylate transporter receptor subunit TctC
LTEINETFFAPHSHAGRYFTAEGNMLSGHLFAVTVLTVLAGTASFAQSWPAKPVRIVVPYTAGSATDIIPRTVFATVEKRLGQRVIVDNRPGGTSTIGTGAVAKAEPDGYTFLATSSAFTTVPLTVANLTYDPLNDFAAVIPLAAMTNVLVVSPDKGIKTVDALVAHARAGALNYVTIGVGSAAHLNSERFRLSAGFDAVPIPFKGSPEGLAEVMAGRVDFYFSPLLPALGLIQEGKLIALAVSGARRDPLLPDVPTTLEAGFVNSTYTFWFGVFAPAKTPSPIVDRLHQVTAEALDDPSVREKLAKLGVQPMPKSRAQFDEYVRGELEQNTALVMAAGIKAK